MKKKTKKENKSLATIKSLQTLSVKDTKAFQELVIKTMPEFVAVLNNKEDMANSMFDAAQEMLLVVDDVLIRYFGFTTEKVKEFHQKIEPILRGAEEFEKHGINLGTHHDIGILGDLVEEKGIANLLGSIAQTRLMKKRYDRAGIEYPILAGANDFMKKLKEKNK